MEHKLNSPDGGVCERATDGQLRRRAVRSDGRLQLIGKEANRLDEVQSGLVGAIGDVVAGYTPGDDAWFHEYVRMHRRIHGG